MLLSKVHLHFHKLYQAGYGISFCDLKVVECDQLDVEAVTVLVVETGTVKETEVNKQDVEAVTVLVGETVGETEVNEPLETVTFVVETETKATETEVIVTGATELEGTGATISADVAVVTETEEAYATVVAGSETGSAELGGITSLVSIT